MPLILEGRVGDDAQRWTLTEGKHRVGRGAGSEILLADRSVSREHAEVLVESDKVEVRDLGSRNGTWVNGQAVTQTSPLAAGDALRFGSVELVVTDSSSPARQATSGISPSLLAKGEEIDTSIQLRWEEVRKESGPATARDRDLLRVITEAGQLLVAPRPLDEVFEIVLELVGRMVSPRRALLLLREDENSPLEVRASRPPGAVAREKLMLSRTVMQTVVQEKTSLLVTDAQQDPRFRDQVSIVAQNIHSALVAPLFDNERVIGLVYADTSNPFVRYDEDQLRAFTMLANLIAVKITNTRLLISEKERERIEQELATAAHIQQGLLPSELPVHPEYELHAAQLSCFEVAGDLYDAALMPNGRLFAVLGDVSGKGMGAALLMSHVMASLRLLYDEGRDITAIVERIHKSVLRSSESRRFVTLFFGCVDPSSHRLEYVNAGHNPPFVLDREGGLRQLDPTGLPMGLVDGIPYECGEIDLPEGTLVCVFSDGIPEASNGTEFYGDERLLESLRSRLDRSLAEISEGVLADLRAFLGDARAGDDVTLLLLRRRAV